MDTTSPNSRASFTNRFQKPGSNFFLGFLVPLLVAAVGLAFAAYDSLLDEKNRLRPLFALMSLLLFTSAR